MTGGDVVDWGNRVWRVDVAGFGVALLRLTGVGACGCSPEPMSKEFKGTDSTLLSFVRHLLNLYHV